ncbi:hypothetical protein K504DRAFT_495505 [Pleomassaria siparia CBS 279.74]|uniref:NACHT domain-containing protein n=1 Tax=Pleomassaria siparia CBS 279.74 TaxID=1314801 RepID=A0A6G1JS82_9PLEO|nr:hypothetical protein K504DRAFT_495505 [Pleomassaria siparia CBS 279.74]
MASSTSTRSRSFWRAPSERLRSRFRRKLQHAPVDTSIPPLQNPHAHQNVPSHADLQPTLRADVVSAHSTITGDAGAQIRTDQSSLPPDHLSLSINPSTLDDNTENSIVSSDLWSAAYREAVESLGKDVDVATLLDSSAARLFAELEGIDKGITQQSAFLRGVAYLHSIQVPLERFKLALDLASPLANLDPVASTVFGVVRSVTAIAISFATADLEFAKQIGEMLKQISYIDDCDTLGQRVNKTDIHKELVCVYQKILEFYRAAHEILTQRGRRLAMKMVLETDRLPNIVQDFLAHADTLRKLIEKSTWEIVEDIKSMLYDHEIARWLQSSRMNQQARYHNHLKELRSDEACKFLLTHPDFTHWYNAPDSQLLLVLGEMGCGKTVAMTFIVDELNQRNGCQIPRPKVCYYYCRDDETGQAVNILSGLILALLEQLSGLKKTFYEWYKENQASGILDPAASASKLGEFMELVLATFDRLLFIVIDGLDECDRASRRTLLQVLEKLLKKTPRLKILLSSRPEEEILEQLDQTTRIALESNVDRDNVIVRHTVQEQLSYLSDDVRELVIGTLSRLAQGSAIWTKMTVELIEVRQIKALAPMRLFLENMSLPGQLSELYTTLLSRNSSNDPENAELAALALKLLAAACRPLSIQELAWAVALAAAQHEINTIAALAQLVDHQRVMSLIYPFITRVDFADLRKRQVRLVHQSVKEFVIRDWSYLKGFDTSTGSSQAIAPRIESLEAFMLDICIKYLLLQEVGTVPLFSDEQIAIDELPQEVDLFSDRESFEYNVECTWEVWEEDMTCYDPTERGFGEFFVYASSHWLKHFGATERGPFPRLAKLESLCQAGSMRLHNWIDQNCRPGCAIKARFDFDSELYDPLSITSLYGSDAILRDMLQNSDFDRDNYLPSPAASAADQILQWGDLSKLKILFLEGKLVYQLRNLDFFRLIIKRWSDFAVRHENWEEAFGLVDHVLDVLVNEQWGNALLSTAARAGCLPMIQRLMDRAQHMEELKTELWRDSRPIGEAVLGDHVGAVECLLSETGLEVDLRGLNSRGENLLHMASVHCNPAIFRLLVPRLWMVVHQVDGHGETALIRIVKSDFNLKGRYEAAKMLLSHINADWTAHIANARQEALLLAMQLGDAEMCHLLIFEGSARSI